MEEKRVLKAKRKKAAMRIQCIARAAIAKERVRRIKHLRRTRYTYIYSNCIYESLLGTFMHYVGHFHALLLLYLYLM
jgi:hypothetical protein